MSATITLPRAVVEQVREALLSFDNWWDDEADTALAALDAALEEQEQKPEPVAFWHRDKGFYWAKPTEFDVPTVTVVPPLPLYTAPPKPDAIARAVEAEREAICQIVYGLCVSDNNAQEIVNAIRARGSK